MFQGSLRRSVHAKRQYQLGLVLGAVGLVLSLAKSSCLAANPPGKSVSGMGYRALHFVDAMIERLAVLHQRSEFAMRFGGHVNRFEFIHRCHTRELEGIVFVGFAFDV